MIQNGEEFWDAFVNFWIIVWTYIQPWLWLIFTIVGILIAYIVITRLLKRYIKKSPRFPKDATNGLLLIVRLSTIIALIFVFLSAVNIPSEYLVDISTIIATAVGFASTIAVSNLIAGLYMIVSHPYRIGDYISVDGSVEGIVKKTSLNYTTIEDQNGTLFLIPNNKLLSANLINYCFETSKDNKKKKKQKEDEEKDIEEKLMAKVSDIFKEKRITRYVFEMKFPLDQDSDSAIEVLDRISDRWAAADKFGHAPTYYFKSLSISGAKIRWAITTKEPQIMVNNMEGFLDDIWVSINKLREEN
ncbi:MAG: mechanosensitive ion channel family protein [Promethearchaeota archaeon]|nr:MAG: mechanosensitive ion channel family protein [Candidatus Lokiarchaeota archaeon]